MRSTASRSLGAQRLRWERLRVVIRCGLRNTQPALIRTYLGLGRWLVQQGQLDEIRTHQRMLNLLLDTARDDALPWLWRSFCLEHTVGPLARLTTRGDRHDTAAAQTLLAQVQAAQDEVLCAWSAQTVHMTGHGTARADER